MRNEAWRPFGVDETMNANYEVLYDGVPHWMQQSLTAWLGAMLSDVLMAEQSGMDVLHRTERALRIKVDLTYGTTDLGVTRALLERFRGNELQLTDYLLSTVPLDRLGGWEEVKDHLHDPEIVFGQLEILLKEAGSKWQIGIRSGGSMGLVQRVPEGVEAALTQTIESSGRAGARLASAWASAFGISPHPS